MKTLDRQSQRAIRRFLVSSWSPIGFDYRKLTESERKCCTEPQFLELVDWLKAAPEDYDDLELETP